MRPCEKIANNRFKLCDIYSYVLIYNKNNWKEVQCQKSGAFRWKTSRKSFPFDWRLDK